MKNYLSEYVIGIDGTIYFEFDKTKLEQKQCWKF